MTMIVIWLHCCYALAPMIGGTSRNAQKVDINSCDLHEGHLGYPRHSIWPEGI